MGGFFKEQVGERFSNLVQNRGFRTNDQFYNEVGDLLNSLGDEHVTFANAAGGARAGYITLDQQKALYRLQALGVLDKNDGTRVFMSDGVDKDRILKREFLKKGAGGLELLFQNKLDKQNIIYDSYGVNMSGEATRNGEFLNGFAEADRIQNGSIIGADSSGKYKIMSASQVRSGATIYINGIRNDAATLIKDGAALQGALKNSSNMYFVYNESRGNVEDGRRAANAALDGSMLHPDEASANTLSQLLQTGKVERILAHSNGNNIALNVLYALEKPKFLGGPGMNFSNVTYFGIAANHGPVVDGTKPEIMPMSLNTNSTFFMHSDDYAINSSYYDSANHPMSRLRTSVTNHKYQYKPQQYSPVNGLDSHNVQGYMPWVMPMINSKKR